MERKYKGLQEALDMLPRYCRNDGYYVDIFYDIEEDEIYGKGMVDIDNTWTILPPNSNIIEIGKFVRKISEEHLIELIEERMMQNVD